jgi:hypothetical protein
MVQRPKTGARLIQAPSSRYSMSKVTILQVSYKGGGRPCRNVLFNNYLTTTEDVEACLRCLLGELRVVQGPETGARLTQASPSRYSMGKVTILQVWVVVVRAEAHF